MAPLGGRDDASAGGCDAGGLGRGLGLDHQVPLGAFFRAGGTRGGVGAWGLGWGMGMGMVFWIFRVISMRLMMVDERFFQWVSWGMLLEWTLRVKRRGIVAEWLD